MLTVVKTEAPAVFFGGDARPTTGGFFLMLGTLAAVGVFAGVMHHYGAKYEREEGHGTTLRRKTKPRKPDPWMR